LWKRNDLSFMPVWFQCISRPYLRIDESQNIGDSLDFRILHYNFEQGIRYSRLHLILISFPNVAGWHFIDDDRPGDNPHRSAFLCPGGGEVFRKVWPGCHSD